MISNTIFYSAYNESNGFSLGENDQLYRYLLITDASNKPKVPHLTYNKLLYTVYNIQHIATFEYILFRETVDIDLIRTKQLCVLLFQI